MSATEGGKRAGVMASVGGFKVFVSDSYGPDVKNAFAHGAYENNERRLAGVFLRPGDRVLELGAAIGAVAMTAAAIVGAENVLTFDANAEILADAKANFARNGLGGIEARVGLLANRSRYAPGLVANFGLSHEFWASRAARPDESGFERIVQTPVYCLEDVIAEFRANVLICDIEGGEVELLSGADLSGLRLIILETHYWATGEAAADAMVRDLVIAGFAPHLIESRNGVLALRR